MASASSSAVAASTAHMPVSAAAISFLLAAAVKRCHRSVVAAGRMASHASDQRARSAGERSRSPNGRTSARDRPSASISFFKPNWGCSGCVIDERPAFVIERMIERRQHQRSVRQRRHHPHQLGCFRVGAGHARHDHRSLGRRGLQPFHLGPHQSLTPRHRRDEVVLRQMCRPELGDDLQERERARPMLGIFLRHQLAQPGSIDVRLLQRIDQPGQFLGQLRRLRRRPGAGRLNEIAIAPAHRAARRLPIAAPATSKPAGAAIR